MTTGRCSKSLFTSAALAMGMLCIGLAGPVARASGEARILRAAGGMSEVRQAIEERARQLLAAARKGRSWVTPRGVTRWPILINDELRGSLWENVELPSLGFGDHWQAGDSARIELTHEGRVVGMLWVRHD
ncbi:MAG: hypothetical protein FD152_3329 [Xanthobacteraceae bacterium]|nr:MAG: hypothetical protein FD152_3329 [Xanthobacteraceae bacterium]